MLRPRESGAYIADKSKHVFVVEEEIFEAASKIYSQMKEQKYSFNMWKSCPAHPKLMNEDSVNWIFVVDCLNFSFWLPGVDQFQLEFEGCQYNDYDALCNAINRALKEGIPITSPSYFKSVTLESIQHVFRSCNGTTLPLLTERMQNLHQAGEILCQLYKGSFCNVIADCNGDVNLLISKITDLFPSFRDVSTFSGQSVSFYKRVQILIADIWACFEGRGYGQFDNINELTMFADYRVPQSLQALGVLRYSENLLDKIKRGVILDSGSVEEMEIRGCSIYCVELLCGQIEKLMKEDAQSEIKTVNSVILDFYLWDYATRHPEDMKDCPEHKTRSIFY